MTHIVQFHGGPWDNRTAQMSELPNRFRVTVEPESIVGATEIHLYDLETFGITGELGDARWPVYRYHGVERRP